MTPRKITEAKDVLSLIDRYKNNSTLSNCYLLGPEIERLVHEGMLQYAADDVNAFLLEDKDNCYRIHYMVNSANKGFHFEADKPLMLEILFRGNDGLPEEIIGYWETQGFRRNLVRKHLSAKYSDLRLSPDSDHLIHIADSEEEADFSRSLFNHSFDPYSGDYICKQESLELVKHSQILIAQKDGEPLGALHFYNVGKCAWIGHVAVSSQARGHGLGQALVSEFVRINHIDEKSRYALWVQEQNQAAVSMYERFGFKYAGKSSLSMIKE